MGAARLTPSAAMSTFPLLQPRDCPICGANAGPGISFFDRRIDVSRLTNYSFASRKSPEYMCFTLLRCPQCDVVYACEAPGKAAISDAYHAAAYDSQQEAIDAAETYERALRPHLAPMLNRRGALDIGTGTGVFLQCLRSHGFTDLIGVEPSVAAVNAADPGIRPFIRLGPFQSDQFEQASLSLISCFMTLEHVPEPATLVRECFHLLRPGGLMTCVVHDWRAWNNRMLGRRSPIVDIEHLQLFSKASVHTLFQRSGFVDIRCRSIWNSYRLDYWNRLFPTPSIIKRGLDVALRSTGVGRIRMAMNVGNLMVFAHKEGS